ncbi:MAG: tRNA adenosine(34) deaminase TadA, partial [Bdellovibrionales bacterium]|nr:tRNA adenosine(34) deaminase TadA [Bdellovibrionales bacterium]
IYLARIKRVVFGFKNPKGGALLHVSENEKLLHLNHHVEISSGIREFECASLLTTFFKNLRQDSTKNV